MATTAAQGRKFDAKLPCGQDYLELGKGEGNGVMKREGEDRFLNISIFCNLGLI